MKSTLSPLDRLLLEARACRVCAEHLPCGPRPVLQVHGEARILIIGQAPGRRVHESGVPWDDPSGKRLRDWLGVEATAFYDPTHFALVPMGFCYPGTGRSGDLPPRPECAPLWHARLLDALPRVDLVLLLSRFAQEYYLGDCWLGTVTETVREGEVGGRFLPLPHPSPRNNRWLKQNPWFAERILPFLQQRVAALL